MLPGYIMPTEREGSDRRDVQISQSRGFEVVL